MVVVVVEGAAGSVAVIEVDMLGVTIVAQLLPHPLRIKLSSQALVGSEGRLVSSSRALHCLLVLSLNFGPTLHYCATVEPEQIMVFHVAFFHRVLLDDAYRSCLSELASSFVG